MEPPLEPLTAKDDPTPVLTRKLARIEQNHPEFYAELTTPTKDAL